MTNMYIEKLDSLGNTIAIYTINNSQSFEPDYSSPVSPMPLPQNADTQNILIKIEGNSSQITENWTMKNYSSSVPNAVGSYSGYVAITATDISAKPLTPFDQIMFWKQFILPIQITDRYRLTVADKITISGSMVNGSFVASITKNANGVIILSSVSFISSGGVGNQYYYQEYGTITGLKPVMTGESPNSFSSGVTFMVGNVVSAYETNVPSAPQNLASTTGAVGSATINLRWSAPTDIAGGLLANPYFVYRRTWNSSQALLTPVGQSGTTYIDTSTTSGTVYYYTIVAKNNKGLGISSVELSVTSP